MKKPALSTLFSRLPPLVTVALLGALACGPCSAADLSAATVEGALALARESATALAPRDARIEASAGKLDPRLQLAACARIQTYVPDGMRPWGRTRIGLRCVEGPSPWNVFLPVTVQVFAPALVSTRALPAGAVLEAAGLERAEVDWAADPALPTTNADSLVGRQLSHPVGAGQPVRSTDIRPREWFAAGDTVRVVANGPGFSVSSQGQALNNGIEGQTARVRIDNGRIVSGTPVADHRLDLDL